MENREQLCHLLLWRLGDKMQRHENMNGPSMESPTETKTEPLQCIKLLPVQKQYYIESQVAHFCSYGLFLILSEQFCLNGRDWLL